jgi:ceramide glucosyltransferase
MLWQTLLTALPTALSAALFSKAYLGYAAARARPVPMELPEPAPWVSILKPVAGRDDGLAENLASFTALDYPAFELLLGVASLDDPAVPTLRAFLAAHPGFPARLIVTTPARGAVRNPKVAQLISLAEEAKGAILVVSDANVRVPRGYLRSLVAALSRPGVGLVSSVVVGAGERTLAAAIDSAQLGAYVAPSVAAAHALGVWPITVGKSMAMWRRDLAAVGGFESVSGVLAEDDVLGRRFQAAGRGVDLCLAPVENRNAELSWRAMIDRHARWAMLRRTLTPAGFAFELLLSPPLVALAVALLAPSRLALTLFAAALSLSCAGAFLAHLPTGLARAFRLAALEPLRIAAMTLCWGLGWVRRRVSWRGHAFVLGPGSSLEPETHRAPFLARFATLARSLLAGSAATLADLAALAFAVGVLHAAPRAANVPALLVGGAVQFFGNRHYAFRAASGALGRQAALFLAVEAVALTLNAALYHAVAAWAPLTLSTAVGARVVTTHLVFLLWSFPAWKRVFRPADEGALALRGPASHA